MKIVISVIYIIISLLMIDSALCEDIKTINESHFYISLVHPQNNNDSKGTLPLTMTILPEYELMEESSLIESSSAPKKYWVSKKKELTEKDIENVEVQVKEWDEEVIKWRKEFNKSIKDNPYIVPTEEPEKDISVVITFNAIGADKFRQMTANYKGRRIAVVLENSLIYAPYVAEEIESGTLAITYIKENDAIYLTNKIKKYIKN